MTETTLERRDREMLEKLQQDTFDYFVREAGPHNGLIADQNRPGSPASIAATGLGLTSLCVAVERNWMSRTVAVARILATLRFFDASAQGPEPDATGYHGFYYHFLYMQTGTRAGRCELSTIDTALLIAGMLCASAYFTGDTPHELELRRIADSLYRRVDWAWACRGAATIGHGWTPERGFLEWSWNEGYSEAIILYALALGSPTFPVAAGGYRAWAATFERKTLYGQDYFYAGPLFIHQLSHLWIDFRGIHDDRNRELGCDYFENSRRATVVHQQYGIENPRGFAHYSQYEWGLTASDGPGPAVRAIDGVRREFYGYRARGAPFGPDDGTISPWAVVASLPFAPELVCTTLHHAIERLELNDKHGAGFDASFNSTFPEKRDNPHGWVSPWRFGLNEGPIVLMIENHASGLVWNAMRTCPYLVAGLRRAGFRGGWLDGVHGRPDQ